MTDLVGSANEMTDGISVQGVGRKNGGFSTAPLNSAFNALGDTINNNAKEGIGSASNEILLQIKDNKLELSYLPVADTAEKSSTALANLRMEMMVHNEEAVSDSNEARTVIKKVINKVDKPVTSARNHVPVEGSTCFKPSVAKTDRLSGKAKGGVNSVTKYRRQAITHLPCPFCGVLYGKAYLKKHQSIHLKPQPLPCEVCGKQSLSAHRARLHMRGHNNKGKHKCGKCDRTFRTPHTLKTHRESGSCLQTVPKKSVSDNSQQVVNGQESPAAGKCD